MNVAEIQNQLLDAAELLKKATAALYSVENPDAKPEPETAFRKQVRRFIINTKRSALYGLDWAYLAGNSIYKGDIAALRTFRKAVLDEVEKEYEARGWVWMNGSYTSLTQRLKEND